jgi:hypothetical protein
MLTATQGFHHAGQQDDTASYANTRQPRDARPHLRANIEEWGHRHSPKGNRHPSSCGPAAQVDNIVCYIRRVVWLFAHTSALV